MNASRRTLASCTIKCGTTNLVIRVGDDILLKAPEGRSPYVAEIVEITSDRRVKNVRIAGKWYYHPEDTRRGRRNFHGSKELFRSDHVDIQLPESIEGKCTVHTFEEYVNLREIDETDYYYRMDYVPNNDEFHPKRVQVFCSCELPWNPDLLMVECDRCRDWFHPECQGRSREEAESVDIFICNSCTTLNAMIERQITSDLGEEHANKRPRTKALPSTSEIPDDSAPIEIPDDAAPSEVPGDASPGETPDNAAEPRQVFSVPGQNNDSDKSITALKNKQGAQTVVKPLGFLSHHFLY